MLIQPIDSALTDWDPVAARVSQVPGVRLAEPVVQGQALAVVAIQCRWRRGARRSRRDLAKLARLRTTSRQGRPRRFDRSQGIVIGTRLANQLSLQVGET